MLGASLVVFLMGPHACMTALTVQKWVRQTYATLFGACSRLCEKTRRVLLCIACVAAPALILTWNLHLSPKPAAALSSFARAACTGLSVMPCAVHPNLRLMCLLLPPMPQPTSTICRQANKARGWSLCGGAASGRRRGTLPHWEWPLRVEWACIQQGTGTEQPAASISSCIVALVQGGSVRSAAAECSAESTYRHHRVYACPLECFFNHVYLCLCIALWGCACWVVTCMPFAPTQ